jgi:hypothetical protein
MEDLLTISSISPRQVDNYMNKKGFLCPKKKKSELSLPVTYFEKTKKDSPDSIVSIRSIELFQEDDRYCLQFKTCSPAEYQSGIDQLKKSGFVWDENRDSSVTPSFTFRKSNIIVDAKEITLDGQRVFNFLLQRRELPHPSTIRNAEDLLVFDSHEFLAAYFGESNVKKDIFYFSEHELRKCTVLFGNTSRQAVFIWENENSLSGVSFILISGLLPTLSAVEYSGNISQNTWELKNGIRTGMRLKELVQLNGGDFNFYGNNSEFSLMIEPENTGTLDFKKIGVMLSCFDNYSPLLSKKLVSAAEAAEQGLSVYVAYVMVSP